MAVIDELASLILALRRDHPTRVLIDGRSASGKTTFATALEEGLARSRRQVVTIHFDDFHPDGYRPLGSSIYTPASYLEKGFDFAAFEQLVLAPTAPGGSRKVALALQGPGVAADVAHLSGRGVLLVEGAFLLKPAYRRWWDVAVWLDVGFGTMIERAMARDVAWVGDAENVRARYETFWRETHSLYEASGPCDAAHVVIDNERPGDPKVVRWSLRA